MAKKMTLIEWERYLKNFPTAACVKVDPRNKEGKRAHTTGRITDINVKNQMAVVELKGHKRPEIIELKYCTPWQKGREMQTHVKEKRNKQVKMDNKKREEHKQKMALEEKDAKFIIMVQNGKPQFYTEKMTFSSQINDAKLYDRTSVGRARGQIARKKNLPGEPFFLTLGDAKIRLGMKSARSVKPLEKDRDKPQAVKPEAKPQAVKPEAKPEAVKPEAKPQAVKPEAKPKDVEDDGLDDLILDDLAIQAGKIKSLQAEKRKIKTNIEEEEKRLQEIETELKNLVKMFRVVYDI